MHLWHWLTSGQNSSAISTIATVIAAISATFAGIFAVRAYRSALEQVAIAREQAALSYKQFLESVRPELSIMEVLSCSEETGRLTLVVKNVGLGRAIDIQGSIKPTRISTPRKNLFSGSEFIAQAVAQEDSFGLGQRGAVFLLWYSSLDGRSFRTETWLHSSGTILGEETLEHPGSYKLHWRPDRFDLNIKFDEDPRKSKFPDPIENPYRAAHPYRPAHQRAWIALGVWCWEVKERLFDLWNRLRDRVWPE